jgi:two-component system, chemotaxis family, chemotaxis protein CheY
MRALIIDDSRAMRAVLGRILTELGFETSEAGNGREGLEHLREHTTPDLALVDWNMPEMNGIDFVQAVRAAREYDGMRLVMVTTETEMTRVVKALGAGVDAYIMKPFAKAAVVEQLQRVGLVA